MKNLTGTEKQVAWAEDIRSRYTGMVETLKEAVAVLSDTTQVEVTKKDAWLGTEVTRKAYTAELTGHQRAAISAAEAFVRKDDQITQRIVQNDSWLPQRRIKDIYGFNHEYKENYRLENRDEVKAMLDTLTEAIETQTDAKYWIDRR